jgi:hypothetical protein
LFAIPRYACGQTVVQVGLAQLLLLHGMLEHGDEAYSLIRNFKGVLRACCEVAGTARTWAGGIPKLVNVKSEQWRRCRMEMATNQPFDQPHRIALTRESRVNS